METNTLPVPGATLYYEVRGSGPALLLICGGIYDAAGYGALAEQLADRYTVVTYDRRGNSRSPLEGPPEQQSVVVHADDAHRVLAELELTEPAYVFGNSSGAEIGLELAARHPEQVQVLVAHEPPVFDVLPEREHWRALMQEVADTFVKAGAGPAMGVFGAGMGMHNEPAEEGTAAQPDAEMMARMGANMEFFIGYEVPPFSAYSPDVAALRGSSARIVLAAGDASAGEPPHRAALALAELLGSKAELFPGDHGGFGTRYKAFAARLHEVLRP